METFLLYWGPTLVALAVVVIAIRAGFGRQAKYFKTNADNSAAQTAALERIASALEAARRS